MEQRNIYHMQLKFNFITMTLEEIAEFVNKLIEENKQLENENKTLKEKLRLLEEKHTTTSKEVKT